MIVNYFCVTNIFTSHKSSYICIIHNSILMNNFPCLRDRGYNTCLFVCLCVCLRSRSFISKSKQAATLRLGNLRQKVVLYEMGKFLQVSIAQTACKLENKKSLMCRSHIKDIWIKLKVLFYSILKMRKDICGNFDRNVRYVLTLPISMFSIRLLYYATVLPSNSCYTVVASIFLVSAVCCKAKCGVASVRTSDYSQPF